MSLGTVTANYTCKHLKTEHKLENLSRPRHLSILAMWTPQRLLLPGAGDKPGACSSKPSLCLGQA